MRRLLLEQPVSAAAVWARRFAVFALALAAVSLGLTRTPGVGPASSLAVFGAAILLACVSLLLAIAGAAVIWRDGRRGVGIVLGAVCLAGLLLAGPAFLMVQALRLPLLNDVSTDLLEPPDFSRSGVALAARGGVGHGALPETTREAQRLAYPNVQPILIDIDADDAWQLVQKAVAARGWRVIEQAKPGGRAGVGHIEAVDRTLIMGFSDDVTVRLRPLAGQTRIDVRSASRIGRHDFGANARRIESFAQDLQVALDAR